MIADCFYICLACFLFGLLVGFFVHKYEYGEREGIDTEFLRKYDNDDNGTVRFQKERKTPMTTKEITCLAIKFVTDKAGDKEYNTIWNLSKEELDIFYEMVNILSAKRV